MHSAKSHDAAVSAGGTAEIALWRQIEEVAHFVGEGNEIAAGWAIPVPGENPSRSTRFLTASPRMRQVLRSAETMARTDWPIVIQGETGTGKELVARLIHHWSQRCQGPFLAVNCAALPETLAESELFGCERGSYTGAAQPRAGYFEQADGGTLLLDEISELPVPLQGKLLRVLEEGQVYRLGTSRPRTVAVRVLALSNRPLERLVQQGQFRADLFHRLGVLQLHLPPLRERPEDISLLAEHFLELARRELRRPNLRWAPLTLLALKQYPWPGNVRQLRNMVWQAALRVSVDDTTILPEHLFLTDAPTESATQPVPTRPAADDALIGRRIPQAQISPAEYGQPAQTELATTPHWPTLRLRDIERMVIVEALRQTGGHRRRAAQLLGVSPRTLCNKLRRYRIVS
ncbi:Nitrogen assimilation regulatory protein [bacterium HR36]|nr:Nitrogen assimilation regulatory protein [bacterium HR36]